jgi:hypothetical protein
MTPLISMAGAIIANTSKPIWSKQKDRRGAQLPHGPWLTFRFLGFGRQTRVNGVRNGRSSPSTVKRSRRVAR